MDLSGCRLDGFHNSAQERHVKRFVIEEIWESNVWVLQAQESLMTEGGVHEFLDSLWWLKNYFITLEWSILDYEEICFLFSDLGRFFESSIDKKLSCWNPS